MNKLKILLLILTAFIFAECGNPGVNVNDAAYEPKIAVEGYLYCGEPVKEIRLMRNFPLGVTIDTAGLYLTPQRNNVAITINGTPLNFDAATNTYYNSGMNVDYGKTYTLEVSATVDGKNLQASSSTTTPQKGFAVINNNLGQFKYDSAPIVIDFKASPGTDFYAFSVVPDIAGTGNFIYNNVLRSDLSPSKVSDHLNDYKFRGGAMYNINSYSDVTYPFTVDVRNTWFYSAYTVIAYAGDKNFKDYFMTAPSVQEFDGNFHEPVQIFSGDGIGVFASAIRDTVRFSIAK